MGQETLANVRSATTTFSSSISTLQSLQFSFTELQLHFRSSFHARVLFFLHTRLCLGLLFFFSFYSASQLLSLVSRFIFLFLYLFLLSSDPCSPRVYVSFFFYPVPLFIGGCSFAYKNFVIQSGLVSFFFAHLLFDGR